MLALFVVSGLVYRDYRNKQRNNLLLNAQQKVINDKNASLEKILSDKDKLLFEKDLLLKEVHNRVKNNLHIVMSLLESQSAYLRITRQSVLFWKARTGYVKEQRHIVCSIFPEKLHF